MSDDKNIFGGGNPNFIYTPMTETEQEVLQRLIDAEDLEVVIHQWGVVNKFRAIRFGDLRLQLEFWVVFRSPEVHIPVRYFELELRTRTGHITLHREKQSLGGQSVMVGAGVTLPLIWDIAIQEMDPRLVKAIKPGAHGLTTREGNRHLNTDEQKILHTLREKEKAVRDETKRQASEAENKSVY
jgi:hypothetical protein